MKNNEIDVGLGFKLLDREYSPNYIDHYYLVFNNTNVAEITRYWDGFRVSKFITGDNPEATTLILNVISKYNEQIARDIEYNKREQEQDNLMRESIAKEKALKALGLL